ncbi:MAG: hypothetical protein GX346_02115 [Clostridiales bacterium]|nr:hypothetical protein [Clostridiales bacterium]
MLNAVLPQDSGVLSVYIMKNYVSLKNLVDTIFSLLKGCIMIVITILLFTLSAVCLGVGIFAFASGIFMLLPTSFTFVSSFSPLVLIFSGVSLIFLGISLLCLFIKGNFFTTFHLNQLKKKSKLLIKNKGV